MPSLTYQPRLDGLRAIAVTGVLIQHFIIDETILAFNPGGLGVRLFFVLSGYLITAILLRDRSLGPSVLASAKRFYWRRTLRLAPPYYLAIALAFLWGLADMRAEWWAHALYLTNFLLQAKEAWTGAIHFWTLAVEEQFYLIWFLVVIAAPRKWLLPAIVACLIIAPLFRSSIAFGYSTFNALLLPGQIDAMATGALVAVIGGSAKLERIDAIFRSRTLLVVSIAAVLVLSAPIAFPWSERASALVMWGLLPVLVNVAAACSIRQSLGADANGRFDVLAWPWMRHVGRISYGIYVYHYFVALLILDAFPALGGADVEMLRFVILSVVSIGVAQISWVLLEKPFLSLKDSKRNLVVGKPAGGYLEGDAVVQRSASGGHLPNS